MPSRRDARRVGDVFPMRVVTRFSACFSMAAALSLAVARETHAQSRARGDAATTETNADAGLDLEASRRELAAWLDNLVSPDAAARASAVAKPEARADWPLAVLVESSRKLTESADRDAVNEVLATLGRGTRKLREEALEKPPDGGYGDVDWLAKAMKSPAPADKGWRETVTLLGLVRQLARQGSGPAVRELLGLYTTFGAALAVDLERQILLMGERALPALIEIRRGESKEARLEALRILEGLGKAIPGEAVQTQDDRLLAEILTSYGRAKEADSLSVVFSFANSDRTAIRKAAREAIVLYGERGLATLGASYENFVGKKAPTTWSGEELAREYFAALDRARLADVYALMDQGRRAYAQKDLAAAVDAFDRVLAREPGFAGRTETAPAYFDFARAVKATEPARAEGALRQVLRVDPGGASAKKAEAELLLLEATRVAAQGVASEGALRQVLELDPGNEDALRVVAELRAASEERSHRLYLEIAGALLGVLAIAGAVGIIALKRRSPA